VDRQCNPSPSLDTLEDEQYACAGFAMKDVAESLRPAEGGLRVAELVADVSRQFIDLPPKEVDRGIHGAVQAIVDGLGFDQGIVAALNAEKDAFLLTHRYARARPNLATIGDLVPLSAFPWSTSQIMAGHDVRIADTRTASTDDCADVARWVEIGVRAFAVLPLITGGEVTGAFIFLSDRPSNLVHVESLPMAVRVFARALDKRKVGAGRSLTEQRQYRDTPCSPPRYRAARGSGSSCCRRPCT
jgi:GAF domain-containing protein